MVKKMRRFCLTVIGGLLLVLTGAAVQSEAQVSVNIGVNIPAYRFDAPPEVVVIPGTYVYMVPGIDVDVLFYQGYWWRPYEGRWYRSRTYKGSWSYVPSGRIPSGLRQLPQDYHQRVSPGHERIPHRDLQRNWKKWEKDRHWDNRGDQGRGRRDQHEGRGEEKGRY